MASQPPPYEPSGGSTQVRAPIFSEASRLFHDMPDNLLVQTARTYRTDINPNPKR